MMEKQDLISPDRPDSVTSGQPLHPAWPIAIGTTALACGYLGMGLPQHYYQPLFAGLIMLLGWRHHVIDLPTNHWRWPLAILLFLLLCMLFKLLIGGGTTHPFAWLKIPVIGIATPPEEGSWYTRMVPEFDVSFKGIPNLSDWAIDVTKIQTLFLVATLVGAMVRFQPFASLTALALLVVSIPTLASFNWDWVLMFLILTAIAFYLRSPSGMYPRIRRQQNPGS